MNRMNDSKCYLEKDVEHERGRENKVLWFPFLNFYSSPEKEGIILDGNCVRFPASN